jgi:hypothetical protein
MNQAKMFRPWVGSEPAESVLLDTVTEMIANGGSCQLFAVGIGPESRPPLFVPIAVPSTRKDFAIVYCSIPVGAAVRGEGYYRVGEPTANRFHIFTIESDAGVRVGSTATISLPHALPDRGIGCGDVWSVTNHQSGGPPPSRRPRTMDRCSLPL